MKKVCLIVTLLMMSNMVMATDAVIKTAQQYDSFLSQYRYMKRPDLLEDLLLYVDASALVSDPYRSVGIASFYHCAMKGIDQNLQSDLMDTALYMDVSTARFISSALLTNPVKSASYYQKVDEKIGCFYADGDPQHITDVLGYVADIQSNDKALVKRAQRARLMLSIEVKKSEDVHLLIQNQKSDNELVSLFIKELGSVIPHSHQIELYNAGAAVGDLEPLNQLSCINLNQIENDYTAADLMKSVGECIRENKIPEAANLYRIAKGYALFDRSRIQDSSVGTAFKTLALNYVKPYIGGSLDLFISARNKKLSIQECHYIQKLGPPTYYPRYMVQHGIKATITGLENTELLTSRKLGSKWSYVMNEIFNCPFRDKESRP